MRTLLVNFHPSKSLDVIFGSSPESSPESSPGSSPSSSPGSSPGSNPDSIFRYPRLERAFALFKRIGEICQTSLFRGSN